MSKMCLLAMHFLFELSVDRALDILYHSIFVNLSATKDPSDKLLYFQSQPLCLACDGYIVNIC